jgi:hypothetical protein
MTTSLTAGALNRSFCHEPFTWTRWPQSRMSLYSLLSQHVYGLLPLRRSLSRHMLASNKIAGPLELHVYKQVDMLYIYRNHNYMYTLAVHAHVGNESRMRWFIIPWLVHVYDLYIEKYPFNSSFVQTPVMVYYVKLLSSLCVTLQQVQHLGFHSSCTTIQQLRTILEYETSGGSTQVPFGLKWHLSMCLYVKTYWIMQVRSNFAGLEPLIVNNLFGYLAMSVQGLLWTKHSRYLMIGLIGKLLIQ